MGGSGVYGTVFKINTDGSGYAILHNFDTGFGVQEEPSGSLTLSGSILYGMTDGVIGASGGVGGYGTVFKINTDGTGYGILHNFAGHDNGDGAFPHDSLTLSGYTLYGTTWEGGSDWDGTVFKINIDGTGYAILHNFTRTTWPNPDGEQPMGSLTLCGSTLYGMTWTGGTNANGVVFRINTDGSGYEILHHFAGHDNNDGEGPCGSLTLSGSTLYGMTSAGGSDWGGTVFKINTDGTGYAILHNFTGMSGNDGDNPEGSLTLSGSILYGMTEHGGRDNLGVIFALPLSSAYTPSGSVQFSFSAYSAKENGGMVTVVATRTGGSSGAARVDFATANGTAIAGQDYTSTNGILMWADGDSASKTFMVPILDNGVYEGNRSFVVTLSGAAGASLGSPASASVTVSDDETPPNQPPLVTKRSPAADPAPVAEGASIPFSVTMDDSTDPSVAGRGMSNVTWYVDGVVAQITKTVTQGALTSAFTLKTATNTVVGAASRDVAVRAVALDKQGGVNEINWTVRVNNQQAVQAIAFKPLPVMALGGTNYNLGATASSGLTVAYSNANSAVATIEGGMIHVVGAGTTVITASQPGNIDFKAAVPVKQTLTVKALLTAEMPDGGGSVTGAGLYQPGAKVSLTAKSAAGNTFLRWEDGSQSASRSLVMPNANVTVGAWFGITTNIAPPAVANPGSQRAMVGVPFSLPLTITSESLPAVTVAGLPTGLAYVPASKTIAGVPAVSVTNKPVAVKVTNVNRVPGTNTFFMTVEPLPKFAQGTFDGDAGTDAMGSGSASMSVTAQGQVSGKIALRGTNFSFAAKSYTAHESDAFTLVTTASVGKASMPMVLILALPEITDTQGLVPATLSRVTGTLNGDGWMTLYRNVWKDPGMVTVLTNNFSGYYTSVLPGGSEYGSGYLAFTVDKAGVVKTAGKLADGTALSLSSALILDESGSVGTVVYSAPASYKGGGIYGVAVFDAEGGGKPVVRTLEGEAFEWDSLNPAATSRYGAGFYRLLGIDGGWYDTLCNLCRYYSNAVITVRTYASVAGPTLLVGTNRYGSAWWDPDGLVLAVVTNNSGNITGLTAQKTGTPVKIGSSNVYDYAAGTNTLGLTVALTRATGVFKGSFKAWFDYVTTHTSESITYEGVLTPEREDMGDGVAGRGFFLWGDKGAYENGAGKTVTYPFSWSYDFLLLGD